MNRPSRARAIAALLIMSGARLAAAHAHPAQQTPAAGQTLATAPQQVAIDFDEGVEAAFTSITVTDAQGRSVTQGKSAVDAANDKHAAVALKPLTPGNYSVTWTAVARDGHRTQGRYAFTVK
ncbi:MAG: copper homeostasis periplasmic binding protein CopC [Janthinobacterium lividum]